MKGLKKNFWPYFSILLIVFLFFWKTFLKGLVPLPADFIVGVYYPWLDYKWGYATGVPVKNPILTDVVSFTFPMQMLGIDLIKSGKLPLWNPHILGGTPLLANFQSAPFSPTNFLYLIFDKLNGWSSQIIFQHVLAMLFTYLLLRSWNASKISSVLGGLIFAFSGYNLIWSQWNGHTLAASFIPLILFFEDRFLLTGKFWYGAGISISLMLLFLSGYPQVAIYLLIAVFVLWIFRVYKTKDWIKKSLLLFIFFLLGFGLSAVQIFPGAELLKYSQREVEPHPFEWAFLPWSKIITFIAPDFYGNHATANYWGPQDYTSNTGFVGVIGLILSSISLFVLRKKKEVFFAFTLMILSLVFAFPTPISIFLWKSGLFGLNAASAHRSLVLFNLAISLMSAFGFDFLSEKINLKKRFLALLFPTFLIAGFAIYTYSLIGEINRGIPISTVAFRNLIFPGGILFLSALIVLLKPKFKILLIPLVIFELFRFGWKFTAFSPKSIVFPTTPVIDFLISQKKPFRTTGSRVIPINMRMAYGIESLEGYDAVYPLRISRLIAAINSGKSGTDPVGRYGTVDNFTSPLMDMVGTKYIITLKKNEKGEPDPDGVISKEFEDDKYKVAFEDRSVSIVENKNALPRSFFVSNWEIIKGDNEIIDRLLDPNFDFSKTIILEEEPQKEVKGFMFTSDTFYPGWKASVDGKETKVYRANFAFRAVPVITKDSKVEYLYYPDSFYTGLKVSLLSLVLLLLVVLKLRR